MYMHLSTQESVAVTKKADRTAYTTYGIVGY